MTVAFGLRTSAVAALVRRDLVGASRRPLTRWSRGLALLASGSAALMALSESQDIARHASLSSWGVLGLFLGLVTAALGLAPFHAVATIRAERDRGTLDLLRLAGLIPTEIALGRVISTLLQFAALLAWALPAACLFFYFRNPSLVELVFASLVFLSFSAALSGFVVAVSAWVQSAAVAGIVTLTTLIAWAILASGAVGDLRELSTLSLLTWIFDLDAPMLSQRHWFVSFSLGLALNLGVAALGVLVAARGVARASTPRLVKQAPLNTGEARRPGRRAATGAALRWLVRRRMPVTRPGTQALVIGVFLPLCVVGAAASAALTGHVATRASTWNLLLVLGHVLMAGSALASVILALTWPGAERNASRWDAILGLRTSGRQIVGELGLACLQAAAFPFALGACLVGVFHLAHHHSLAIPLSLVACYAVAGLSFVVQGLAASVMTRSAALAASALLLAQVALPALFMGDLLTVAQSPSLPRLADPSLAAVLAIVAGAILLVQVAEGRWRLPTPLGAQFVTLGACTFLAATSQDPGLVGPALLPFLAVGDVLGQVNTDLGELWSSLLLHAGLLLTLTLLPLMHQAERLIGRAA